MIGSAARANFAAAPAAVWQVITDIAREPQWMRAVKRVDFVENPRRFVEGALGR